MPPATKTAPATATAAATKAGKADEKAKVLDPKAQLEKFLKANEEDHFNLVERPKEYVLSSGSFGLDIEGVVFPPGVFRMCGAPNLGKTPFLINLMDTLLDEVPNSRVVWALAEGRMSKQNALRFRHPVVYSFEEWDVGTVFVFKTNTFETWLNLKRELVSNNPTGCRYGFVTDSVDNMILKADMVKEFDEALKVAGTPAMSKRLFQKMGLAMRERGHWSFFVSQKTAAPKIAPYAKTEHRQTEGSGGNALAHNADEVLEFQEYFEGDLILKNPDERMHHLTNPALGHNLRIKIKKSSNEKRFITVEIPIKHGVVGANAIWKEREIGDVMLGWQLVTKTKPKVEGAKDDKPAKEGGKGSWLYMAPALVAELEAASIMLEKDKDGFVKMQGLNQLYALLEGNKELTAYLFKRLKEAVSSKA